MCAVSREQRPVDELIRFVVSPQGEVIPDIKRKLPGRGLWISASRQTVAEAVRRHQFSRGFKRDVRVAESLAADTETLLARAAVEALAIAAKAGQVISGFAKVEAALADRKDRGAIAALVHASDGASDGIRKLQALARQNAADHGELPDFPAVTALTFGRIGFGTGPVKCGTCCAARGPGEQDIPVAQPDPGPIPGGRRRQDCRNRGREFEINTTCINRRCAMRTTGTQDF